MITWNKKMKKLRFTAISTLITINHVHVWKLHVCFICRGLGVVRQIQMWGFIGSTCMLVISNLHNPNPNPNTKVVFLVHVKERGYFSQSTVCSA